jgi:large subunit ribosomal protein L5
MHFLNYYDNHIVKYDLINKFRYKKLTNIPRILFISLRIKSTNFDLKSLVTGLAGLELITIQKGTLIKSKVSNISLKIRKGQPVGCKVTLRQNKMLFFLTKLINHNIYQLVYSVSLRNNRQHNMLSLNLSNVLIFSVLEKNYQFFKNLKRLDINIVTTPCSCKDFLFFIKAYKLKE